MTAELFHGFDRFSLGLSVDDPDDHWLLVRIEARAGDKVWSDEDTCLTQREVEGLADWFEGLSRQIDGSPPVFAPHESNLRFERSAPPEAPEIRIACDLEFAPPEWNQESPFTLRFALEQEQLAAFASALRADLRQLAEPEPVRTKPLIPGRPPRRI